MTLNFPTDPQDGDVYEGYIFEASTGTWDIPPSTSVDKEYVDTALMGKINISDMGIAWGVATLDQDGYVDIEQLAHIIGNPPAGLNTLEELAGQFKQKTTSQWASDSSILPYGSINVENDGVSGSNKYKIGNGTETWAQLPYVADSEYLAAELSPITTDISAIETTLTGKADLSGATFIGEVTFDNNVNVSSLTLGSVTTTEFEYLNGVTSSIQSQLDAKETSSHASSTYAPKASPTFSGNVSLPSTTSIGNVSSTELSYVDGVTSAIQTQIDAVSSGLSQANSDISLKAPINAPTFTGTVSGITKSMVGLGNVDNTADSAKPISTATQTALDLKAPKANPTFTGTVTAADVSISGNLTVTGTTTTVNATNLEVNDSLIYLSANQYDTDIVDIGIFGAYGDANAGHFHTGLIRDASDAKWKLVSNGAEPSSNVVDFTSITYDTLKLGGLEFSDGTQTKQGVPSLTGFVYKTTSYTLDALTLRDNTIEVSSASATTITIPLDSSLNFPVGTSIDILQTNTGQVTIAATSGVTLNGTPGFKLRTQWSSATILKRAANTWVVYGDLMA